MSEIKTTAELAAMVHADIMAKVKAMDATSGEKSPEVKPHPKPVRLLLSEAASRHLDATGESAFIVASRAMAGTEEPHTAGRWALWLIPCSIPQADSAVRVARGLSMERKVKASPA